MEPGKLRHTIRLEKPVRIADSNGVSRLTWQTVATVKAGIQSAAGAETIVTNQLTATITHIVTMRHLAGVNPALRVVWTDENRVFQIIEVKQDSTFRRVMVLKCAEVLEVD